MDGQGRDVKGEAIRSSPLQMGAGTSPPTAQYGRNTETPSIGLPKGGGAIRGIGEKFAANPVTGTGSMIVTIATSPRRSGFGPQLSISYDSGAGNGPFGFGWNLSLPSVTRETDNELPQYFDAELSDVFLLFSAEDLVPVRTPDDNRFVYAAIAADYIIHRYCPHIEGLFTRNAYWTRKIDDDVCWRSIFKGNSLTLYSKDADSRITDPEAPERIFGCLICEMRDGSGLFKPTTIFGRKKYMQERHIYVRKF